MGLASPTASRNNTVCMLCSCTDSDAALVRTDLHVVRGGDRVCMSPRHIAGGHARYRVSRWWLLHLHPIFGSDCHVLAAPPV